MEYKDKVFVITIPEGGELSDARVEAFSGFSKTGDLRPIRFYAQTIGFEDIIAPVRSWGYSLKDFNNCIKPGQIIHKLKEYLKKIL